MRTLRFDLRKNRKTARKCSALDERLKMICTSTRLLTFFWQTNPDQLSGDTGFERNPLERVQNREE